MNCAMHSVIILHRFVLITLTFLLYTNYYVYWFQGRF